MPRAGRVLGSEGSRANKKPAVCIWQKSPRTLPTLMPGRFRPGDADAWAGCVERQAFRESGGVLVSAGNGVRMACGWRGWRAGGLSAAIVATVVGSIQCGARERHVRHETRHSGCRGDAHSDVAWDVWIRSLILSACYDDLPGGCGTSSGLCAGTVIFREVRGLTLG
jgi:hypothetical protein